MIKCVGCGADNGIIAKFPSDISLSGTIYIPGEVETKLFTEMGIEEKERITDWRLEYDTKLLSSIRLEDVDEYQCSSCKAKGTVEDDTFQIINKCRCGRVDDGLFVCARFRCIMCQNCRDTYECSDCVNDQCFFHRHYQGDETPPKSTWTSKRKRPSGPLQEEAPAEPLIDTEQPEAAVGRDFGMEPLDWRPLNE
jgi:hypothetical protein